MLVSRKILIVSLVAMSLIFTSMISITMIANADNYGGIAQYWNGVTWVDIYPELYIGPGQTVKLRVIDLPAGFNDADLIEFNIASSGWGNDYTSTSTYHPLVEVTEYALGKYVTGAIEWTSSVELTYCNTYTIKYRTNDPGGPTGTWVAQGRVSDNGPYGGHLHYIPEFAFGTVMSMLALLSGLGVYSKFRKQ